MAIGLVDDAEFDSELEKINTPDVVSGEIIPIPAKGIGQGGRNKHDVGVPESLQKVIGEETALNGRSNGNGLAGAFGLSTHSAQAYGVGATSLASYNKPKKDLLAHINKSKLRVAKSAMGKLNLALEHLTPEKLEEAPAKDISAIARNMAGVVKDMVPSVDPANPNGMNNNGVQFVLYAPQIVQENTYQTIVLDE